MKSNPYSRTGKSRLVVNIQIFVDEASCATNRMVAGSILAGVIGIFH